MAFGGGLLCCLFVLGSVNSVDAVDSCLGVFGAILDSVLEFRLLLCSLWVWVLRVVLVVLRFGCFIVFGGCCYCAFG